MKERLPFLFIIALVALVTPGLVVGCRAELQTGSPPSSPTAPDGGSFSNDTDETWTEMQRALVGRWRATTPENRTIETSYRLVSKGSALVETFTSSSGKETITVYHRDGRSLMLTHYCAQGNQARLKATEATRERVVFTFLDATNVNADQSVMKRLAFVFRPDGFDQESVYRGAGAEGIEESTTLHFFREQ